MVNRREEQGGPDGYAFRSYSDSYRGKLDPPPAKDRETFKANDDRKLAMRRIDNDKIENREW